MQLVTPIRFEASYEALVNFFLTIVLLLSGEAAIDGERCAVGEGRRIGGEPQNGFGHFFGLPEAAAGVCANGRFEEVGHVGQPALGHGGLNDGGANGVDPNAFAGVFDCGGAGEAIVGVLAGGISGLPGAPLLPCYVAMLMMLPPPCAIIWGS